MYKIYDSVSYGHLEPLVPFTLVAKFSTFDKVLEYINNNNKNIKYFIFDENNNEIIYE
jgi:hypothetical protein